jgi:hypothetical protein
MSIKEKPVDNEENVMDVGEEQIESAATTFKELVGYSIYWLHLY